MTPASIRRTPTGIDAPSDPGDDAVRAAWATLLGKLLTAAGYTTDSGDPNPEQASHVKGGPLRAAPRTIRRWLNAEVDVPGDAIRDVCRSLDYPALRGLAESGWLSTDEVSVLPPAPKANRLHRLASWVHDMLTAPAVPAYWRELVETTVGGMKRATERSLPPAPVEPPGLSRTAGDVRR
jgi:hypothetical protein